MQHKMKDEESKSHHTKEGAWRSLKENLKALYKPRNILILGSYGAGKSSFINTVITALTGEYRLYADIGCGSRHNTTRLHRIPREDYWNPNSEDDQSLNLPTFIDIMGLDPQLSDADNGDSLNSKLMNLIINGHLQENCDLLDLGKQLKERVEIQKEPGNSDLSVDIIVLVISADNSSSQISLAEDIYAEANTKTKQIPVFAVITKVDKCELSKARIKDIEDVICSILCISSNHVLLCNNYQFNHIPDIQEDIAILEFLNKLCDPGLKTIDLINVIIPPAAAVQEHSTNNTILGRIVLIGILGLMLSFTMSVLYNIINRI